MDPLYLNGLGLAATTALVAAGARGAGLPHSILLVLAGAVLAFVPGVPRIVINPDMVLLLMLPPLLYSAGVGMSWQGFRFNLRPIMLLAVGCVLFTAAAVAAAAHVLLGVPWAVGFVLGAVVSPPDAVAPMAIARRLGLPQRILTVLEGEGLVNDATALILFSFAVAAVETGGVSVPEAMATFVMIVTGETLFGVALGWGSLRLRRLMGDPQVEIVLALLVPYVAFWPPHALGGSGVIAAVAAGLYVSWNGPRFISVQTRLQGYFVWGLVVHLVEGLVFLLTGLQAHVVLDALREDSGRRLLLAAAAISAVVVLVRFVWVFPGTYLPRLIPAVGRRDPPPGWQVPFLIGFTGLRGVVSLAAALSIPLEVNGQPFPERALILFCTFCVIFVTLVGQGTLLPSIIRWLGLADAGAVEAAENKAREVAARVAGVDAALVRLDALAQEGAPAPAVAALRRRHLDRRAQFEGTASARVEGSPVADNAIVQLQLNDAERAEIAALHHSGAITDEARRRIERELDLEEARIRHAAESATGNERAADPETEQVEA